MKPIPGIAQNLTFEFKSSFGTSSNPQRLTVLICTENQCSIAKEAAVAAGFAFGHFGVAYVHFLGKMPHPKTPRVGKPVPLSWQASILLII